MSSAGRIIDVRFVPTSMGRNVYGWITHEVKCLVWGEKSIHAVKRPDTNKATINVHVKTQNRVTQPGQNCWPGSISVVRICGLQICEALLGQTVWTLNSLKSGSAD